ncbi:CAP domain-containing protein [Antribacter sp. KLBMP9083]|uniref:CAP domain-containing protein n=1 Tax=Antribacter soli TaxID=2910976 RepID=A0AA41QFL2_9MICO|nr:CAP domain-containing protein [Antribacter soli]MCF4122242.1 CAP domain-containing protein [Antribacter soli]
MTRRILRTLVLVTAVSALAACGSAAPGRGASTAAPVPPTVVATGSAPPESAPVEVIPAPEPSATPSGSGAEAYAEALEGLVNDQRGAAGLALLVHDDCAAGFALERAQALVGAPELKHAPLTEVLDGCDASITGENLSRGNSTPEDVIGAWMDSPSHMANIVKPEFAGGAIACAQDGGTQTAPRYVCSQVFLGG